ncbi:pirin family protein [Pelagibius sp.]|uniref:pirin family protein n=1 Tax=Pelagibius sp. TaxID=1931238 RepID=UPI003B50DD5F
MALLHEGSSRGRTQTGWLDSRHTFSFGPFHDPGRMGHRSLRVLNEDRVIPGAGFPSHDHEHMEILTYVVSGALAHRDSLGNGSTIQAGEIQRMSAGSGITHSEMNASAEEPVHFLQIWVLPERRDLAPSYEQTAFDPAQSANRFAAIAAPDGGPGRVRLHQDASLLLARLEDGREAAYSFAPGRAGFLQVVSGRIEIAGEMLSAGDGLQFDARDLEDGTSGDGAACAVTARSDCEVLLFDLA